MTQPAIQVDDLHKSFGDNAAVQGVSFNVQQGEIFSLLGPNGAGKTTTISMLSTLLRPDAGRCAGHGAFDPQGLHSRAGGSGRGPAGDCPV